MKNKRKTDFKFSEFLKELKDNSSQDIVKPIESQLEKQYFLIVTEGVRTEPLYFEYFKKMLPNNLLEVELIGEGANTVDVVNRAITEKKKRASDNAIPNFDYVWAVFDKDDFSPKRVNLALQRAKEESIEVGYSNQSFELWYVLHFQYMDACLHRNQYYPILSRYLQTNYEKNSDEIVQKIFELGNIDFAISNAIKLHEHHGNTLAWDNCPYTSIFKLVEQLKEYGNFDKPSL